MHAASHNVLTMTLLRFEVRVDELTTMQSPSLLLLLGHATGLGFRSSFT